MESNKEFITRVVLMINELPEDKRRDYFTLLTFLDFQLKARDNLFVEDLINKLAIYITLKVDFNGHARIKKNVIKAIEDHCAASQYSFKIPDYNREQLQQKMGEQKHKYNFKDIKL